MFYESVWEALLSVERFSVWKSRKLVRSIELRKSSGPPESDCRAVLEDFWNIQQDWTKGFVSVWMYLLCVYRVPPVSAMASPFNVKWLFEDTFKSFRDTLDGLAIVDSRFAATAATAAGAAAEIANGSGMLLGKSERFRDLFYYIGRLFKSWTSFLQTFGYIRISFLVPVLPCLAELCVRNRLEIMTRACSCALYRYRNVLNES